MENKSAWFWVRYVLLRVIPALAAVYALYSLLTAFPRYILTESNRLFFILTNIMSSLPQYTVTLALATAALLLPFARCRRAARIAQIIAGAAAVFSLLGDIGSIVYARIAFSNAWVNALSDIGFILPYAVIAATVVLLLAQRGRVARWTWIAAVVLTILCGLYYALRAVHPTADDLLSAPWLRYLLNSILSIALFTLPVYFGLRPGKEATA